MILLSTTGLLNPVPIFDLGAISFPHPTVDYILTDYFTLDELNKSTDLFQARDAGYITLKDEFGNNLISTVFEETYKNSLQYQADKISNEPTGFLNRTDSVLSFDNNNRTFTISPVISSFVFYTDGIKWEKTTPQNIQISNTAGIHYIYFDTDGELKSTTTFFQEIITKKAFVSSLYYNSSLAKVLILSEERHGVVMDGATHLHLHSSLGTLYDANKGGLQLEGFNVNGDGSLNNHALFYTVPGTVRDEDISFDITSLSQTLSPNLRAPIFYKTGLTGTWAKKDSTDYVVTNQAVGERVAFNQFTGVNWQQTTASEGYYVVSFIVATTNMLEPIIVIQGRNQYENANLAYKGIGEEVKSIIVEGLPSLEYVFLGAVLFQTSSNYTNDMKARIVSVQGMNYLDYRRATRSDLTYQSTNIVENLTIVGRMVLGNVITPPTITTNQNNYNPAGLSDANIIRASSDANRTMTGLQSPNPAINQIVYFINIGTSNIVFSNNSGSSLAENRFALGANKTLNPEESILFVYDSISLKWRAAAINA